MAFGKSRRSDFLTYEDFLAGAKKQGIGTLYLFVGAEDFLIDQCIKHIVDALVPPEMRGFNLDVLYGTRDEAKDVVAHASSYPMMGERRVVLVKEFERLVLAESARDIVARYLQHPLESTCLVLVAAEPDFRRKPFPELKKTATVISCDPLYDNQVPSWIAAMVHARDKEASPEACRLLQAYVGNSLRSIDNELDKLLIYVGDRKEIKEEDIAAVVGASRGFTVFDLQNCIGRKDTKEAITVLGRMMQAGESPQMIIVMLTRFFTTLLKITELKRRQVAESQFAAELRISPYFLRQYIEFQSNFPQGHIERAFHALLAADAALKTSAGDPRIVMDLLVYSLIRGEVRERVSA
jgi:DNA polymerase-3 subunit delta